MSTRTRQPPLRRLADTLGVVSKYLDQTGKEWRRTSPDSCAALLAAMGFDAATDAAADAALRALRAEARRSLVEPVRVVEMGDLTGTRHVPVRLASPPSGDARWRVELTIEGGTTHSGEGPWPGGTRGALIIPWPEEPPLGYHWLRVTLLTGARERVGEQSLIVVPRRCVTPRDLLGDRRAFGFVANLYTLRSEANWGIGDTGDLGALVAWSGEVGGEFVGVNPLHALLDRGEDISPYSPVSRLFRNPIYIDVLAIPELRHAERVAERVEAPSLVTELNVLREVPHVHYERVMELKASVLEELHQVFAEREHPSGSARARAYDEFVRSQDPELTRFATWMAIAEQESRGGTRGGKTDWHVWPAELQQPDTDAVRRFQREHARRIDYHKWVQFELDRQLGTAARRAKDAGMTIGLYQDLAIGTSPNGADTWAQPELFVQGASVGAPPDPYSASGQNWGLPPMDPRGMRRDRYRYFVRLLRSGFRHAGALRIDHVMGLFRLFWIPEGRTGKEGAFVQYPANDLLGILALESVRHNALVVGEDLGTVPKEVPAALEKWGVLSSKVLYFEREKRGGFKPAEEYGALALATANTHDMATIAGFWKGRDIDRRAEVGLIADDSAATAAREERERDKRALLERLETEGIIDTASAPSDAVELRGAVHEFLCRTPAALVGLALDDLAGEEEAVNLPGIGPDRYPSWTRKMAMTIEEMRDSADVRRALRCAGRARGQGLWG